MIELPDTRQMKGHDCGHTVVLIVCKHAGVDPPADLSNCHQGLSPDTVEALDRAAGLNVLAGNMTVDDLAFLTKDRLVQCPIKPGHWVVVRGVARRRIHVQDPFEGPLIHSLAWWNEHWGDTTKSGQFFSQWGICAF